MLDPAKTTSGIVRPRCSRCSECKKSFRPHPRLSSRQKICGEKACKLKHRARYKRSYRAQFPGPDQEYADKAKSNRPKAYWKNYRKKNPKSTERNRVNTKLRKRLARAGLQRQLDIVQVIDPPGYFETFCGFATSHRSLIERCGGT
jgi:hypothetical protein